MSAHLSFASLAVVVAVAAVLPQDGKDSKAPPAQPPAGSLCSKCKTTGKVDNPAWKEFAKLEQGTRFCSYVLDRDPNGYGIPWMPCRGCRNDAARLAAEAEYQPLVDER